MEVKIAVEYEHLGGPGTVTVGCFVEPGATAYNETIYAEMALCMNRALAAVFTLRDDIRFQDDRAALRDDAGRRIAAGTGGDAADRGEPDGERKGRDDADRD